MANHAALLGRISWDLFRFASDADQVEQMAFNLTYHLKQDFDAVLKWPARLRRERWKRVLDQYEFEEKEAEKRR